MKLIRSLSDIVVRSCVVGENGCVREVDVDTFVDVAAFINVC